MTNQELLQDTINYYWGNKDRHCMNGSTCKYSPKSVSKEGKSDGCAIGRLLPDELKEKFDKEFGGRSITMSDEIWSLIPADIAIHGRDFLRDLQTLHDSNEMIRKENRRIIVMCSIPSYELKFNLLTFPN